MKRIFMTRDEAVHLLVQAHASASGHSSPLIQPAGNDPAKLEVLDRLLLDVRAGRVNEFRLDANDSTHIAITD
ncbi:MAG: hypothetical protein EPN70_24750 [Paraburkholderia sp.]|uniref:Uncharacterized protein n=1 Tax=Paraburkholderia denitrificans TaxID=694025 RepID=A0ABW0J840_9BURK|nr:hypothetical protein [Paraburkholderia sp.]TAL99636.1 MAG: hypothetical protein EPN70_24750 [Paraburkholderia sp.]TAM28415.1 MAG: hypothetical protein EPN59_15400 [Paraburkholderia sp.]